MGKEIYNGNANENVMPLKYSELHIHLTNLGEQKRHIWKVLTERPDNLCVLVGVSKPNRKHSGLFRYSMSLEIHMPFRGKKQHFWPRSASQG